MNHRHAVPLFALSLLFACDGGDPYEPPGNGITIPADSALRVHAEGTRIVDPDGEELLLRCTNVDGWLLPIPYLVSDSGNALLTSPSEFVARLDEVVGQERADAFWNDWRDTFITEADFERMAALGFNCARVVVYHRGITDAETHTQLDDARLTHLDRALDWALAHNVYVVLDLHSMPGGQNALSTVSDVPATDPAAALWEGEASAEHKAEAVSLWRQLAERYQDRVVIAGYDLINEPALPSGVDQTDLRDLYQDMAAAIREVDADHMLFIEGDRLAHDFSMFDAPIDDNMVYAFHGYALTGFEDFAEPDRGDLDAFVALRDEQDVPLWLGEFGEGTLEWQTEMITLVEGENIGWALYPWKRKQTWWFNPVTQLIPAANTWYRLANFLAQPPGGEIEAPSVDEAEAGMTEILTNMALDNCSENTELAAAIILTE